MLLAGCTSSGGQAGSTPAASTPATGTPATVTASTITPAPSTPDAALTAWGRMVARYEPPLRTAAAHYTHCEAHAPTPKACAGRRLDVRLAVSQFSLGLTQQRLGLGQPPAALKPLMHALQHDLGSVVDAQAAAQQFCGQPHNCALAVSSFDANLDSVLGDFDAWKRTTSP